MQPYYVALPSIQVKRANIVDDILIAVSGNCDLQKFILFGVFNILIPHISWIQHLSNN
jgi:hypothetical protein